MDVLVVSAGGGLDTAAMLLAVETLKRMRGWDIQNVGFAAPLMPTVRHRCDQTRYQNVVEIIGDSMPRKMMCRTRVHSLDTLIATQIEKEHGEIVYGIPLNYGPTGVANSLDQIGRDYDAAIMVDFGGDVLYTGEGGYGGSLMADAMMLAGFRASGIGTELLVIGAGADAEVPPEELVDAIAAAHIDSWKDPASFHEWYDSMRQFDDKLTSEQRLTLNVAAQMHSTVNHLIAYDRKRKIFGEFMDYPFVQKGVVMAPRVCRDFHLLDVGKIVNPLAIDCWGLIEWYARTQEERRAYNELDQHFVVIDNEGPLTFIAPPDARYIGDELWETIFSANLREVSLRPETTAMCLTSDWNRGLPEFRSRLDAECVGPYTLATAGCRMAGLDRLRRVYGDHLRIKAAEPIFRNYLTEGEKKPVTALARVRKP